MLTILTPHLISTHRLIMESKSYMVLNILMTQAGNITYDCRNIILLARFTKKLNGV